jgi:hypothetical protein
MCKLEYYISIALRKMVEIKMTRRQKGYMDLNQTNDILIFTYIREMKSIGR